MKKKEPTMSLVAHHQADLPLDTQRTSPSIHAPASGARGSPKALIEQFLRLILVLTIIAGLAVSVIGLRIAIWMPNLVH
jgi:hypothetical protein